jgi:hypothetical protein
MWQGRGRHQRRHSGSAFTAVISAFVFSLKIGHALEALPIPCLKALLLKIKLLRSTNRQRR